MNDTGTYYDKYYRRDIAHAEANQLREDGHRVKVVRTKENDVYVWKLYIMQFPLKIVDFGRVA